MPGFEAAAKAALPIMQDTCSKELRSSATAFRTSSHAVFGQRERRGGFQDFMHLIEGGIRVTAPGCRLVLPRGTR